MSSIVTSTFIILLYFISLTTSNFEKLKVIHRTFASSMSRVFRQLYGKNAQLFLRKKKFKKETYFYAPLNF